MRKQPPPLVTGIRREIPMFSRRNRTSPVSSISSASSGSIYPPTPTDIEPITPFFKSPIPEFAAFRHPSDDDDSISLSDDKLSSISSKLPIAARFSRTSFASSIQAPPTPMRKPNAVPKLTSTVNTRVSKPKPEPFGILGGRDRVFTSLPSPGTYDKIIRGEENIEPAIAMEQVPIITPPKPRVKRVSGLPTSPKPVADPRLRPIVNPTKRPMPGPLITRQITPKRPGDSQKPPLSRVNLLEPPKLQPAPKTPDSILTFAAVYDPHEGLSTFRGSSLLKRLSSNLDALDVSVPPRNARMPLRCDLQGYHLSRNLSSLDLCSLAQLDRTRIDDEDFWRHYIGTGHPDCEPHLASRFSTTTTSTSNYINVDFGDEPTPEETFPEPRTAVPKLPSKKQPPLERGISSPFTLLPTRKHPGGVALAARLHDSLPVLPNSHDDHPPSSFPHHQDMLSRLSLKRQLSTNTVRTMPERPRTSMGFRSPSKPRLSSVLGKFRRNSSDDGWVHVDVEIASVIKDRVVRD